MTIRTTTKFVTFNRSFNIFGLDELLPAGTYKVETDEELLEGLSFTAWKRKLSFFHFPGATGSSSLMQVLQIDPKELDAALRRDSETETHPADAIRFEEHAEDIPSQGLDEDQMKEKSLLRMARELKKLVKTDRVFRAIRMGRK